MGVPDPSPSIQVRPSTQKQSRRPWLNQIAMCAHASLYYADVSLRISWTYFTGLVCRIGGDDYLDIRLAVAQGDVAMATS